MALKQSQSLKKESRSPYDLRYIHKQLSNALYVEDRKAMGRLNQIAKDPKITHTRKILDMKKVVTMTDRLRELIVPELFTKANIFRDLNVGYSQKYNSLTFALCENRVPRAIVIRSAKDREGKQIKWKTYGSKTFTPYRIDPAAQIVYIASGIGEYLLFELLGVSFIGLQSDSTISGISPEMILGCEGKMVVYCQDNDESAKKLGEKLEKLFDKAAMFTMIDFEILWDRDLPKGYDLRDFVNEVCERERKKVMKFDAKAVILEYLYHEILLNLKARGYDHAKSIA